MSLDGVPGWLPGWCVEHLGSGPTEVLFQHESISVVVGVRLASGRGVVVKARADDGRAVSCLRAQQVLADRGVPCARPITPVCWRGSIAVHAEELLAGGEVLVGDSPEVASRYAEVFSLLMAELTQVQVAPPVPNPRWVRWDHPGSGLWPSIDRLDAKDQSVVPGFVVETAQRARRRLVGADLPCVLGHADFEAQNLRWRDGRVWAVHDWDSLAWQPEAALVGAASGMFANSGQPTLAPLESSEAFIKTYETVRGRRFTTGEREVVWAASLWPAAHNARWEALHGDDPVASDALASQAADRLRRAGG